MCRLLLKYVFSVIFYVGLTQKADGRSTCKTLGYLLEITENIRQNNETIQKYKKVMSTIEVNGDQIMYQSERCLISKVMRPNYCSIVVSMRNAYSDTEANEKSFPTMQQMSA